jgi:hypothetical protein
VNIKGRLIEIIIIIVPLGSAFLYFIVTLNRIKWQRFAWEKWHRSTIDKRIVTFQTSMNWTTEQRKDVSASVIKRRNDEWRMECVFALHESSGFFSFS